MSSKFMNLYLASIYTSNIHLKSNQVRRMSARSQQVRRDLKWKLESFHYIGKGRYVERMHEDNSKGMFLDSGAYSSYTKKIPIDIYHYAEFIREHREVFPLASVLDHIDFDDSKASADNTWRNQKKLESLGCEVLPCFHFGENTDVVKYYAQNYKYITIGGMVPISNNQLKPWLDEIWGSYLTDKDGRAITKVHGFGLTSPELMERYPWYSVDSSSWVQVARTGGIFLSKYKTTMHVSDESPNRHKRNQHYLTVPEQIQRNVLREVEARGYDMEALRKNYLERWVFCMLAYQELGEFISEMNAEMVFHNRQPILLSNEKIITAEQFYKSYQDYLGPAKGLEEYA